MPQRIEKTDQNGPMQGRVAAGVSGGGFAFVCGPSVSLRTEGDLLVSRRATRDAVARVPGLLLAGGRRSATRHPQPLFAKARSARFAGFVPEAPFDPSASRGALPTSHQNSGQRGCLPA